MASIKFNPFTNKFDYVGTSGVSYIDGVCDDFSALPITLGDPALESVYLVRNGSGVWLINRKPAGLYIRDANNGNLDDWRYLSAFPEVNDAQYFRIYDSVDPTKEIAFSASGISSGTVRTLTVPNKNITIADNADIPAASTATPQALGTAAAGTSADYARADHVHGMPDIGDLGDVSISYIGDRALLQYDAATQTWSNNDLGTIFQETEDAASDLGLAPVASSGDYNDLDNKPTLGTTATEDIDALPETLRIVGGSDPTKKLAFEVDGLTTATTRTLTVPDASGTIARTETFAAPPAIGNTTPNSGAFTTLSANNGTLTASAPVLDLAQTWNASGTTFTGLRFNATNTASAVASRLIDLQVGGTSQFAVNRQGYATAVRYDFPDSDRGIRNFGTTRVDISDVFQFVTGGGATGSFASGVGTARASIRLGGFNDAQGVHIRRDSAENILAQENGAAAQTFRIYNTFTDASNHERGFMRWSSNVLQIGTEKAGTGSARAIQIIQDGNVILGTVANATGMDIGTILRPLNNNVYPLGLTNRLFTSIHLNDSVYFGATNSSNPRIKKSGTSLQVKLADDSAFAPLTAGLITATGNLVLTDNTGNETATFDAQSKLTANRTVSLTDRSGAMVLSDTTVATGADAVTNIVSLTQAEYNAIGSPDAATLFLITDP